MAVLVELRGLSKRFGALQAVAGVSLEFEPGRIHAVVGENGAGKSTLLNMAAGVVVPDEGDVVVEGVRVWPHTAREAIRRGVGMVQQHLALVGPLSVLDNVMLGAEPARRLGVLDVRTAKAQAERLAGEMGAKLPWEEPVAKLGIGDRQRVAIVRALARDARVLLLDEPTAALAPPEAESLYATLKKLAHAGKAIVVVTHRLDEVAEHAQAVSVLRRGRLVSTRPVSGGDGDGELEAIAREVMGGDPPPPMSRRRGPIGATALQVRDLRRTPFLRGVTLQVRQGEIVGVAGVEGNGQRELVRALGGLDRPESGEIDARAIAVVHEDRQTEGLVLDASVRENLVMGELRRFTRLGLIDRAALDEEARRRRDRAGLASTPLEVPVRALSGGNQQKVVVARALAREAPVLVLAHPTRGMDISAARATYDELARAAEGGRAVLVVSADLGELRGLCDRILVMVRGRVEAELSPDAPDVRFGEAMLAEPARTTP